MAEIPGLQLIVPTSVAGSGVSVSASGKVTFTAATSVSVNGCFTATYDNYLVVCRGQSNTDADLLYRLRVSGSDASGSNYTRQRLLASSTSVSGQRATSQTSAACFAFAASNDNGGHAYFYGPALAQPTAHRSVNVYGNTGAYIADYATTHSLSTAYDGFTLIPGAGNVTGALCVYGLNQ